MSDELRTLRERLDVVDRKLVELLAERQQIVAEVTRLKAAGGANILRDPRREEDILTRLVQLGRQAGLDRFFLTRVFQEILDHSVRVQQEALVDRGDETTESEAERPLVVAYQGTEGAYSHLAATRHFAARASEAVFRGYDTFQGMLEAVRAGAVDYAVLPIENTTAGSINEAYDLLARMDLALVGEEIQRVDHCLVALDKVPLSHIRRVYSHPQALAQCGDFLSTLRDCQVEAFTDTAMAVKKIRDEQDLSQAAIASEEAAKLYGLHVLKRGVANQKENFTRMVIVAAEAVRYDMRIACKTSLIFATRHEEGALLECLNVFHQHGLNLTKLESRPRPQSPWEYLFYVDFEGNVADAKVEKALRQVAAHTSFMKVLGSYPSRTTKDAKPAEPRPVTAEAEPSEPVAAPLVSAEPDAETIRALEKKAYRLVARTARAEDTVVRIGEALVGGEHRAIIAGPRAVESREQIQSCARIIKESGGAILRAGCFRQRTSPYGMEALEYDALDLLEEAGRAVGLPVMTEVLYPSDVGKVARKVDVLEVGARNMQNLELLKACGQVDRPVVLKRGTMASIDEWLGAAEYIMSQGNQMVVLCERGIRTFETATRNTLDLSAIPVLREMTHLPVLVDPSDAVGVRRWILPMAEAALASGAHGVFLEVHPEPATAHDAQQALTFDMFRQFMERVRPGG